MSSAREEAVRRAAPPGLEGIGLEGVSGFHPVAKTSEHANRRVESVASRGADRRRSSRLRHRPTIARSDTIRSWSDDERRRNFCPANSRGFAVRSTPCVVHRTSAGSTRCESRVDAPAPRSGSSRVEVRRRSRARRDRSFERSRMRRARFAISMSRWIESGLDSIEGPLTAGSTRARSRALRFCDASDASRRIGSGSNPRFSRAEHANAARS